MNSNLIDIIRRFQTHHSLQEECERTWGPAHSDLKAPNEKDQTRSLMIPGLNQTNDQQSSQDRKET